MTRSSSDVASEVHGNVNMVSLLVQFIPVVASCPLEPSLSSLGLGPPGVGGVAVNQHQVVVTYMRTHVS